MSKKSKNVIKVVRDAKGMIVAVKKYKGEKIKIIPVKSLKRQIIDDVQEIKKETPDTLYDIRKEVKSVDVKPVSNVKIDKISVGDCQYTKFTYPQLVIVDNKLLYPAGCKAGYKKYVVEKTTYLCEHGCVLDTIEKAHKCKNKPRDSNSGFKKYFCGLLHMFT